MKHVNKKYPVKRQIINFSPSAIDFFPDHVSVRPKYINCVTTEKNGLTEKESG